MGCEVRENAPFPILVEEEEEAIVQSPLRRAFQQNAVVAGEGAVYQGGQSPRTVLTRLVGIVLLAGGLVQLVFLAWSFSPSVFCSVGCCVAGIGLLVASLLRGIEEQGLRAHLPHAIAMKLERRSLYSLMKEQSQMSQFLFRCMMLVQVADNQKELSLVLRDRAPKLAHVFLTTPLLSLCPSTLQNIYYGTGPMLAGNRIPRGLLLTQQWVLPRTVLLARRSGGKVYWGGGPIGQEGGVPAFPQSADSPCARRSTTPRAVDASSDTGDEERIPRAGEDVSGALRSLLLQKYLFSFPLFCLIPRWLLDKFPTLPLHGPLTDGAVIRGTKGKRRRQMALQWASLGVVVFGVGVGLALILPDRQRRNIRQRWNSVLDGRLLQRLSQSYTRV